MADYGAAYTDAELKKFEKKINTVYKQASADVTKKMKDFNAKYKVKEAKYLQQLADGKITQEQFDNWKKGQVFQGKQWQAKKDQIADTLLHANETATSIMNGQMTNVFAANANFMSYSLETGAGVNFGFGLYDSATVSNLLKNEPDVLPTYKIKGVKDTAWNKKKVNRQVTLGIIEGESLDKIATRLGNTLGIQNKKAMLTQARTSMTAAQNAGREISLTAAQNMGINVQKEWMCTLDGRTRDWHRMLDGQKQPLDKPFEVDGLKIRFPGDPQAKPALVYNCRCTMVGDLVDYPSTYDRYDNIDGKPIKGMTYQEWEKAKAKGEDISPIPLTWKKFVEENTQTVNIKDLFSQYNKGIDLPDDLQTEFFNASFDNNWQIEIKGLPTWSKQWEMYQKGELPEHISKQIDDLLTEYAKKNGLIKDVIEKESQIDIKDLFSQYDNPYDLPDDIKSKAFNIAFDNGYFDGWDQMWADYLNNNVGEDLKKKIEDVLTKYAKDNGLITDTIEEAVPTFKGLFADKKMSNVYYSMKDYNVTMGNKFYKELQGMGKPSEVGNKYLKGELSADQLKKIDDMLETYAKKAGLLQEQVDIKKMFEGKKMSHVYNDIKASDTTMANKFYKELQTMGKPSEIWNSYLDGTLDKDKVKQLEDFLEKYLKKADKSKTIVTDAAQAAKKVKSTGDPLVDAQNELKTAEEALQKTGINNKTFSGIWKEDVTYADYEAKKASIAAKKQWYKDKIEKYENDIKNGLYANTPFKEKAIQKKIDKFKNYLDDLEDFEKNGKAYSKYFKAVEDAKKKVKKFSPTPKVGEQFADDAFDDATKKAAKDFTNKRAADQFHRQYLDSIWDDLDDSEKYGIWEYTRNSNPMNKSLSGYHDTWSRSGFLGPLNTKWGYEDSWRSIPSAFKKFGKGGHVTYHKAITNTTKAIEKSVLPDGVMLVRGSDKGGFAGMIEGSNFSFNQAEKLLRSGDINKIKQALEGQVIQNHAFTSTGIASGTGFGGDIAYKIYAPKGTKAIYAEPQSYFGNTVGMNAKLYKKGQSYRSVGGEAEVILQRGTKFRITKIEGDSYQMTVHMEIVEQPNYFKYGDEDTFNNGKTRHKK